MPEIRLTCLSPEVKALLEKEMHHFKDPATRQVFIEIMKVVASCPVGQQVGLKFVEAQPTSVPRAKKEKRAPSEYNKFMGHCAKSREKGGDGRDFKSCAADWKRTHPKTSKR